MGRFVGARVAVKVLRADVVPRSGGERFAREIQIMARLQHPNILPVLDGVAHTAFFANRSAREKIMEWLSA